VDWRGSLFCGGASTTSLPRLRVAVFIDLQNCYECARTAFHAPGDPSYLGNMDLGRLARLLAGKGGPALDLTFVGVYCGLADPRIAPKTNSARMKQIRAWERAGITVFARPLQYLRGLPPREKGVDVKLAIDIVMKAIEDVYDLAIIASCDSDLNPAIDALLELRRLNGKPDVAVIAWEGRKHNLGRPPDVPFRWLGKLDYRAIQDPTDYNR
jgi:NYN domain